MTDQKSRGQNRIPPNDLTVEAHLLGAAMLTAEAAEIVAGLGPEPFYQPRHVHIAAAVGDVWRAGQPVDAGTVAAKLNDGGVLEQVGGYPVLLDIVAGVPATRNAAAYAELVAGYWHRRQVIALAGEVTERAYRGEPATRFVEQLGREARAVDGNSGEQASGDLERVLLGHLISSGVPDPVMVHPWIYAGGLHTIQSEPGVGKSWVALWIALQLIDKGWAVVYMDEEGGQSLVARRLAALGADPATVDRLFHYFPFPNRKWEDDDLNELRRVIDRIDAPLALGVFDSLPDFLSAAGLNEDSSMDNTAFVNRVLAVFRDAEAGLLVLDHLPKQDADSKKRTRSRYSRGSGAKLAKAWLTLLLEVGEEFDRRRSGWLKLWVTKDREGFVDLPHLDRDAPQRIDVTTGHDEVTFALAETKGDWEPTECMDVILEVMQRPGMGPLTGNQVYDAVRGVGKGFQRTTVLRALEVLRGKGRLQTSDGKNRSVLYSFNQDGGRQDRLEDDSGDDPAF